MTQNSVRVVDPTNTEPYVEALLEALTLKIEKNNKSDWLVITIEFGGANRSLLLCKEDSSPIDEICDKFKTKLKKQPIHFKRIFILFLRTGEISSHRIWDSAHHDELYEYNDEKMTIASNIKSLDPVEKSVGRKKNEEYFRYSINYS